MSRISVWTSEGKWSEEVKGLDKVHLMKTVIGLVKSCEGFDESWLEDYQIYSCENRPESFSSAKFFTMPLVDLDNLIKFDPACSSLYEKIKKVAQIPPSIKVKSILLMFDDE